MVRFEKPHSWPCLSHVRCVELDRQGPAGAVVREMKVGEGSLSNRKDLRAASMRALESILSFTTR
jgi:hypothetical protein